jgi:hypothetical protein
VFGTPDTISMFGYISTSLDRKAAEKFMQTAIQDPADKDSSISSVLFHIKWDDLFNYHKVTNL